MWGLAIDVDTSSPIYLKECISKSGHITLIAVFQSPYEIKLYPSTFIDEIKTKYIAGEKRYLIDKEEVLSLKEKDVLSYSGMVDFVEISNILSRTLIDKDVDEVIKLTTKITGQGIKL